MKPEGALQEAIERSIELWEWCAKTGKLKHEWPEWKKYRFISSDCFLCQYKEAQAAQGCDACPLENKGTTTCSPHYDKWNATETNKARKKYALLFLEELKSLLEGE